MTNVSKNLLFGFAIVVSATVFSLGAFATTAFAGGDGFGVDGGGYSDFSSYGGGYSDFSTYGGGYNDSSSYGGYGDSSSYGGGYSDFSKYADSYNPGYIATDSYNPGYYNTDSYNPGSYVTDSYNPGSYVTDSYNPGNYETDSYVAQYMDQYAAGNPAITGGSFGGGSSGGGFTTGGGYSMPSFGSTGGCTTCHSQSYPAPVCTTCNHLTPHPTPTCTTCGGSNVTNTNTNITNTNTLIDNSIVDNSINGSFNTTISNSGNTTVLAAAVPQPQIVYQQQYQQQVAAPFCVVTLQNAGAYTAQATLVWSSSNASSAYITSIGAVAPNGVRVVTGYANQTYSLTVTGQGGSYTCHTQYTPTYVPPAPITPSVSLTQIPYTGLALGPVAQMFYWLSLFSVAAAGAYLLVYFKGGALAFAGSAMTRRENHFVVSEQETEEIATPKTVEVVEEEVAAPAVNASLNNLATMATSQTRDIMSVIRSFDGAPRIVINRA